MPTNVGGIVLGELVLASSESGGSGGGGELPTHPEHVQHTLSFTQSVRHTNTKIINLLELHQTIAATHVANISVTVTLNLSQTITAHKVLGVSQNLPLSQSIIAYGSKGVKNTIVYNQTITYQVTNNIKYIQLLNWNQTIGITRSRVFKVQHGFGMNSIVQAHREYNKTVEHTLGLSQEIRRVVYNRTVESIYSPTQSVIYTPVYLNSVSSPLTLNQSIHLNVTLARSVVSNLVFLPSRTIYIGMGDVEYYVIDNIQYSLIPAYKVGKKNNPHCVLQVPNGAITLPSPDWGDTENYGGIFTIRRSMNGIPYTHIRSLSLRKLKLPWTLAKRKAWELREFLIQHNTELMTLTTWKGDKWFVNLTTNPFELVVRGRYELEHEKVNVELEFEGLKVM